MTIDKEETMKDFTARGWAIIAAAALTPLVGLLLMTPLKPRVMNWLNKD